MDEDQKKSIKTLAYLSTVGMAVAFSIALGALIGHYIDKRFETQPWFFLIFLGLGVVAAFRNLYLMYKKGKDL